mgnify:CR=1 FL=1
MFKYQLRPEIRKQLKDPDGFEKGLTAVFLGLTVTMAGVAIMLFLYFNKPEDVLHPTWILFLGFAIIGYGDREADCPPLPFPEGPSLRTGELFVQTIHLVVDELLEEQVVEVAARADTVEDLHGKKRWSEG